MKVFNTDLPTFIGRFSISRLINEIEEIKDNEILMPWYSHGGNVWAGFEFADFLKSDGNTKNITAKVSGIAASMGAALLPYFNKVIGAKQANIMLHSVTSSVEKIAETKNQELYDVLKVKINEPKFKEVTGFELKDILFRKGDDRKDIWLTGQEAFDVGLFDELIDLSPDEKIRNDAMLQEFKLSATLDYKLPERLLNKSEITNNQTKKSMNKNEFKTSHPEVHAEVLAEGKGLGVTAGTLAEKNRVDAWMVFNDVDPEKVKAGIESGKGMTKAEELAFLRASQTLEMQKGLEKSSADNVTVDKKTGKPLTEEQKADANLDTALDNAGIEKEGDK